jgi:hypothetical protein
MTKVLQLYCGEQSGTVRGPPVTFSTVSSYLIEKLGNQGSFDWYRSKLGVRPPPRSWTIQLYKKLCSPTTTSPDAPPRVLCFWSINISQRPSTCSVLLEHQHLLTPLHLLCAFRKAFPIAKRSSTRYVSNIEDIDNLPSPCANILLTDCVVVAVRQA